MRTSLDLLDDIRIASPCTARWDGMAGDDRARHCAACDKTVYDLSRLTADQAADLIREKEGSLCVRLYRRSDGRVLTADCPVGLRDKLLKWRDGMSGTLVGWLVGGLITCLLGCLAFLGLGIALRSVVMGDVGPPPGALGGAPGNGVPLLHHPREVEPEQREQVPLLPHPREER